MKAIIAPALAVYRILGAHSAHAASINPEAHETTEAVVPGIIGRRVGPDTPPFGVPAIPEHPVTVVIIRSPP